jgi:thymidylate synthase (FAD)
MKLKLLSHDASDLAVVNAARVSYGKQVEELGDSDKKLISYLLRNNHGTPFEHGYFRFHVEAPIFVFREWHRHRIGHSYNEISGRYVELEKNFYEPAANNIRKQVGKPGHYEYITVYDPEAADMIFVAQRTAWNYYQQLLERGVAKEQARTVLPLGIYSEMYWSCNPRSLMHFLTLRTNQDAMKEIRYLANQALGYFQDCMPVTCDAWVNLQK